jgi:hypothetical protein
MEHSNQINVTANLSNNPTLLRNYVNLKDRKDDISEYRRKMINEGNAYNPSYSRYLKEKINPIRVAWEEFKYENPIRVLPESVVESEEKGIEYKHPDEIKDVDEKKIAAIKELVIFRQKIIKERNAKNRALFAIDKSLGENNEYTRLFQEKLNAGEPYDLFQAIISQYLGTDDMYTVIRLQREYTSFELDKNLSMESNIAKYKELISKMRENKSKTTNSEFIARLIMLLPESYMPVLDLERTKVKDDLYSTTEEKSNQAFQQLLAKIIEKSREIKIRNEINDSSEDTLNQIDDKYKKTIHRKRDYSRNNNNNNEDDDRLEETSNKRPKFCSLCRSKGHDFKECRVKEQKPCKLCGLNSHTTVECKNCLNCGKPGHRLKECKSRFKRQGWRNYRFPNIRKSAQRDDNNNIEDDHKKTGPDSGSESDD